MPVGHRTSSEVLPFTALLRVGGDLKEKANPWTEVWSPRGYKTSLLPGTEGGLGYCQLYSWDPPFENRRKPCSLLQTKVTQKRDISTGFTALIGLGHLGHSPEPLLYNMWYYHVRKLARILNTAYIFLSAFTVIKTFLKIISDLKFTVYLSVAWSICVY